MGISPVTGSTDTATIEAEASSRAQVEALRSPKVDRKILGVVVHGIGEQSIGSTIKHVANEVFPLVRKRIDPQASIAVKPLDEGDPAEVTIWFRDKVSNQVYELRFLEVWWAQAFEPVSLIDFVVGLFGFATAWAKERGTKRSGWFQYVPWLAWSVIRRLVVRVIQAAVFLVLLPLAIPVTFLAANRLMPSGRRSKEVTSYLLRQIRAGQPALVDVVLILVSPLLLLLFAILCLLEPLRSAGILSGWIGQAQRMVVNQLTRHFGDFWIYMKHPWDASRIRVRFEQRFRLMFELLEADRAGDNKIEALFVIAHSLGSVVAHEGMTGRRMIRLLQCHLPPTSTTKLHFITFGSALNSAWDLTNQEERFRFYRHMHPSVHWLNLYSREDQVARGSLRRPSETGLTWQWGGPASFDDKEVVNQMDRFSDHSAYWNNAEQVVAPALNALTSGALSEQLHMRTESRTRRVSVLAAAKALVWWVVPVVFVLTLILGWGDWLVVWLKDFLPEERNWWQDLIYEYARGFIMAAVVAVAAAMVYSGFVKWLWNLFDKKAKYQDCP